MKKSRSESLKTRQRIVNVAAHEFRLNGISVTGVAALMSKAGMTHGGFYVHFDSKAQLITRACAAAVEGMIQQFSSVAAAEKGRGFQSIVEGYLSSQHREDRAGGCPLAAMGSELARADKDTRSEVSRGFDDLVNILAGSIEGFALGDARSSAIVAMAAMVGAPTISRTLSDQAASTEVLDS